MRSTTMLAALVTCTAFCATAPALPIANNARIFFVGNSYIGASGGLQEYVRQALAAGSPSLTVTVDASVSWGKDIDYMYDTSDAVSRIVSGNWDVVVVQGYWSGIDYPAGTLAMLQRYAAKFDSVITASGAEMVLMMPWTGNPLASWMGAAKFHADMVAFQTNYAALGVQLGCRVVPCSQVWHSLTDSMPAAGLPQDYLYGDDLHQNNLASYLNSWVFYAMLTGRSPVGLDYTYTTVTNVTYDAALRTAMQQRAWAIAQTYLGATAATPTPAAPKARAVGAAAPRRAVDLTGRALGEKGISSRRTLR